MKRILPALLLVLPAFSHANTGVGATQGFLAGVNHPIHGLDHILAMIAVGLWAAQIGGRALWAVPASFVGVMTLGGLAGAAAWTLPMVETGIQLSVLLLGLMIAFAVRPPVWAGALLVGVFALFHGHAHGAEMPHGMSSLVYAAGFVLATAALHIAGMGAGMLIKNVSCAPALRIAGALVVLGGAIIALS